MTYGHCGILPRSSILSSDRKQLYQKKYVQTGVPSRSPEFGFPGDIPQNKTAAESVGPPSVRFFGRPGDRSVASKPSDFAVARTQVSLPYRLPRFALSRKRSTSHPPYGSSQTPRTPVNGGKAWSSILPLCKGGCCARLCTMPPCGRASDHRDWRYGAGPLCKARAAILHNGPTVLILAVPY